MKLSINSNQYKKRYLTSIMWVHNVITQAFVWGAKCHTVQAQKWGSQLFHDGRQSSSLRRIDMLLSNSPNLWLSCTTAAPSPHLQYYWQVHFSVPDDCRCVRGRSVPRGQPSTVYNHHVPIPVRCHVWRFRSRVNHVTVCVLLGEERIFVGELESWRRDLGHNVCREIHHPAYGIVFDLHGYHLQRLLF